MKHIAVWLISCLAAGTTGLLGSITDPLEYVRSFAWMGMGVLACWIYRRELSIG